MDCLLTQPIVTHSKTKVAILLWCKKHQGTYRISGGATSKGGFFPVLRSLCPSRRRCFRWQLSLQLSVGPFEGPLACAAFGNRLLRVGKAHTAHRRTKRGPGLFITQDGMAAYISWRHIPKISYQILKVVYNIKSGSIPNLVPFVHRQRP